MSVPVLVALLSVWAFLAGVLAGLVVAWAFVPKPLRAPLRGHLRRRLSGES